jgi:signal peptidase I
MDDWYSPDDLPDLPEYPEYADEHTRAPFEIAPDDYDYAYPPQYDYEVSAEPSVEHPPEPPRKSGAAVNWIKEVIQLVLIVVVVRIGMDTFIPRYIVDGASMQPNFHTSERVIVDRVSMLFGGPSRGDVVVLKSPTTANELLIKRVIGLPGETVSIQDGRVYIDGVLLDEPYIQEFCTYRSCNGTWELGQDQYFVLGDNRSHSLDSHSFGPVEGSTIIGIARVRYWPLDELTVFEKVNY